MGFHDIAYGASGEAVDLFDFVIPVGPSNKLLYVHGVCMTLAWIFFASSGIITARYLKKTWVGHQICKKDVWFTVRSFTSSQSWFYQRSPILTKSFWSCPQVHRTFMMIAWALTIIGFFCIFAYENWEFRIEPHYLVGIVAVSLCFIQPFMAAVRPHPGDPYRPIFNWAHWGVGTSAHILAGEHHISCSKCRRPFFSPIHEVISLTGTWLTVHVPVMCPVIMLC